MPFALRSFSFAISVAVVEVSFLVFGSGLFALRSVLKKWEDAVDQKRWDCFVEFSLCLKTVCFGKMCVRLCLEARGRLRSFACSLVGNYGEGRV